MAKKHKNLDNIPIQWNGNLTNPPHGAGNKNQNIPASVDLGKWAGEYIPCWTNSRDDCVLEDMLYFEDFDVSGNGIIDVVDFSDWVSTGHTTIAAHVLQIALENIDAPPNAPYSAYNGYLPYTWGDVNFIIEIADGIGTGSRRARENRLNKFDDEKKKKLIHLICRVKGKKVYDEKKEIGDVQIKLEDAELVIERVLGKIKVEKVDVL
tara:strand:+ start:357 stop:980 length:624 start_codon:yes stop_codon:yes gene_type:complete